MGIASLVLGIISLIMSFIPFVGIIFCITAVISIILGIVSLCKKQNKGKSIAGIITSAIAIIITILYCFVIGGLIAGENGIIAQVKKSIEDNDESYSGYNYNETNSSVTNSSITNTISNKEYNVGDKFENDEIAITFVSKDENFTGYREYAVIKDGYKIVKAEFEFENVGDSNKYVSSYNFDCYADGYDCDSFWSVENSSFSSTLSSGKKTKGAVYFQVPKDSESITLEYNINSLDDEIVEFIIK